MWKLFIDDERTPVTDDWVIVRSSADAIQACTDRSSLPNEISFDHDLGGEDTSMKFIGWLIEALVDEVHQLPQGFTFSVHSQNPVGRDNIQGYMDNIIKNFGQP